MCYHRLYCRYALKHNMFSPCGVKPDTSKVLQATDITMQEAVSAGNTIIFYKRQRQDEAFFTFFDRVEQDSR